MPRTPRAAVGGMVYHVLNRANARLSIFEKPDDYEAFETVLAQAHRQVPMRTLAWCVLPNHWHLLLWPRRDEDLPEFMHWLTLTHTHRWHSVRQSIGTGHIYQGRYKSFAVQSDEHYLTACRYVERNALRANLAGRAQDWRWGSLWRRVCGDPLQRELLSEGPVDLPADWVRLVNQPQNDQELAALRQSIARGRPYGQAVWVQRTARRLGLLSTLRPRGRPVKKRRQAKGKCT